MTVRQLLYAMENEVSVYLVNHKNESEYLHFINGEIKFMDLRPYLGYKIISVKPLADNEIRIEYKKEIK